MSETGGPDIAGARKCRAVRRLGVIALLTILLIYGGVVGLMYGAQRKLLFPGAGHDLWTPETIARLVDFVDQAAANTR